jgi:conflict system pore-forming effector with SLATT domain
MSDDLERPDLDQLDWSEGAREASLTKVYEHATELARGAEGWYARKRPVKKRWGRTLRVLALLLGVAAAVLPIVIEITTTDGKPGIAPGWSAVALALAAALVTFDHYFGFSNAWMRFMAAEMRLTRLRHDFEYAWNVERVTAATPPSGETVAALLALARGLVAAVDEAVAQETDGWITEFRHGLARTEQGLAPSGGSG